MKQIKERHLFTAASIFLSSGFFSDGLGTGTALELLRSQSQNAQSTLAIDLNPPVHPEAQFVHDNEGRFRSPPQKKCWSATHNRKVISEINTCLGEFVHKKITSNAPQTFGQVEGILQSKYQK